MERDLIEQRLATVAAILPPPVDAAEHPFSLSRLDDAFATWRKDRDLTQSECASTLDAFGVAYGQFIADTHSMRWVAIPGRTNEFALLGGGDILVYPQNAALANHERMDSDLFTTLYLVHSPTAEMSASMEPTPDPPWWAFWRR
ncbi:MAG: hypothetical protein Aurels2KO_57270 [Aureliella sp.]